MPSRPCSAVSIAWAVVSNDEVGSIWHRGSRFIDSELPAQKGIVFDRFAVVESTTA
jgi:hypothetical protein